jgi:hypothetical protein
MMTTMWRSSSSTGTAVVLALSLSATAQLSVGAGSWEATAAAAASTVGRYEKFEVAFPYTGTYSDPSDPNVVDVEATFTSPTRKVSVPGFLYQPYSRSGNARGETLTATGSSQWMVRFAPWELGAYTYQVILRDASGTRQLGSGGFTSVPSSNPGFVRASGYGLVRDDGEPFIPVGINAPWWQPVQSHPGTAWGDGTYGVDNMYSMFAQTGANFFHFWTCAFASLRIGCDASNGFPAAGMDPAAAWEIDYIAAQAHARGVYMMPVLKHSNQQQYTHADQVKARYFVARWGYETNIVAWDWNKEGATNPSADGAWASYERSIDPYQHLRSTSEWNHYPTLNGGDQAVYSQVFADPNMTMVQNHDYTGDCTDANLARGDPYDTSDPGFGLFYMRLNPPNGPLHGQDPRAFDRFHKPSFFGETGVHSSVGAAPCADVDSNGPATLYADDHAGLILKSQAWGAIMGGSCACAPWMFRFDSTFNSAGTWTGQWTQLAAFRGVSAYAKALPMIPDEARLFTNYQDSTAAVASAPELRVIGRKDADFAMLDIENVNGTALNVLRGSSPHAAGGSVTLKGMRSGAAYSVRWFDTDSGVVERTDSSVALGNGDVTLMLPVAVTHSVAAIVLSPFFTSGSASRPAGGPGTAPPPATAATPSAAAPTATAATPSVGAAPGTPSTAGGRSSRSIAAFITAGVAALLVTAALVVRRLRRRRRGST